jgi:uncharacterized membrane protein
MEMNKRQKLQVALSVIAAILIVFWLFFPGWEAGKIMGIISNALLITGMVLSFISEEKNKKK